MESPNFWETFNKETNAKHKKHFQRIATVTVTVTALCEDNSVHFKTGGGLRRKGSLQASPPININTRETLLLDKVSTD